MNKHVMTGMSRTARWMRWHWPDRNPLRRATDRAEAALICLVGLSFIVLSPVAGVLVGHWSSGPQRPTAARYAVKAVLTGNAPDPTKYSGLTTFSTPARWVTPTGIIRTGRVRVDAGARAGGVVPIWIDRFGQQVGAVAGLGDRPLVMALVAALGAAAFVLLAGNLALRLLYWRRMAAWDADWRVTEPRWSSRC